MERFSNYITGVTLSGFGTGVVLCGLGMIWAVPFSFLKPEFGLFVTAPNGQYFLLDGEIVAYKGIVFIGGFAVAWLGWVAIQLGLEYFRTLRKV
jgi:hypothetical protein